MTKSNIPVPFNSSSGKRKYKDQKFGFGGKKSGMKWNTKDSYNDVSSFRAKVAHAKGGKGGKKGRGGKQNVSHMQAFQDPTPEPVCICLLRSHISIPHISFISWVVMTENTTNSEVLPSYLLCLGDSPSSFI